MICPVCEHPQEAGAECDVCGARLGPVPPIAVVPTTVPDLEPTVLADTAPTPAEGAPWIERTATDPVSAPVEALEVERATADPGSRQRTPVAALACRYCRTPAGPGQQFCERCGMRLMSYRPAEASSDADPVICRGCGTVVHGALCPGCGARAPVGA